MYEYLLYLPFAGLLLPPPLYLQLSILSSLPGRASALCLLLQLRKLGTCSSGFWLPCPALPWESGMDAKSIAAPLISHTRPKAGFVRTTKQRTMRNNNKNNRPQSCYPGCRALAFLPGSCTSTHCSM
ncbi:hypothetical protein J3F84DRAFT_389766 [Trichoderma pleuroticola]